MDISTNIVTHFPSKSLGTLFKNTTDTTDPNIYVLFSGHVCPVDKINATFLTYKNDTINAKILNVNIWTDVACAVLENPSDITFPVITTFDKDPILGINQDVNYFSNYQINNSLPLTITSNVRVPNYNYPQNSINFFYPDSFQLREAQGVKGISGSPVVNSNNNIIGMISKIVGCSNDMVSNMPINPIVTKTSMFYDYLFNVKSGLITLFYKAYLINPSILSNFNLLVEFRNSFNIIICHLGFMFKSYKNVTSRNTVNLSSGVNGIVLTFRITGINSLTYNLISYLQKNDSNLYFYKNLFDGTDLLNDFYKDKTFVLLKTLTYTDKNSVVKTIDLGTESIAQYYVNGDPEKAVKIQYLVNSPSGIGGVNMSFGPIKELSVTPYVVNDQGDGVRYISQLPKIFTSTNSRASNKMICSLYNQTLYLRAYGLIYTTNPEFIPGFSVRYPRNVYPRNILEYNHYRISGIGNNIKFSVASDYIDELVEQQKSLERLRKTSQDVQIELKLKELEAKFKQTSEDWKAYSRRFTNSDLQKIKEWRVKMLQNNEYINEYTPYLTEEELSKINRKPVTIETIEALPDEIDPIPLYSVVNPGVSAGQVGPLADFSGIAGNAEELIGHL